MPLYSSYVQLITHLNLLKFYCPPLSSYSLLYRLFYSSFYAAHYTALSAIHYIIYIHSIVHSKDHCSTHSTARSTALSAILLNILQSLPTECNSTCHSLHTTNPTSILHQIVNDHSTSILMPILLPTPLTTQSMLILQLQFLLPQAYYATILPILLGLILMLFSITQLDPLSIQHQF